MNSNSIRANADTPSVVVTISQSGYAMSINARGHALRADEPESAGGTDTGPTPYELLLASLGACVAATLRMYADRKGWPLAGVAVSLDEDRIRAEDCSDCESESGPVLRITKRVELHGELDEEQRSRLMEIADRCPVHRSLVSEIQISTE